jgi:hypothetical protein
MTASRFVGFSGTDSSLTRRLDASFVQRSEKRVIDNAPQTPYPNEQQEQTTMNMEKGIL